MASRKLIQHLYAARAAATAAPVTVLPPYDGPPLPPQCPRCHAANGERPAVDTYGRWYEHHWTGFDGWQCGWCGFLLPRAAIVGSGLPATSPLPAA